MPDPLANAILQTLHYADIFDYPLTLDELQRYLIGVRASRAEIECALDDPTRLRDSVLRVDGYLMLPQRQPIVAERARLHALAQKQIVRARFYARLLAYVPFVRMIAVTGALAMENARDGDIDLLIVAAPGRLWTVRGVAVALVRLARLRGDHLCPNFLLSENALGIQDQQLYNAHEIVQMLPLFGWDVYRKMRRINSWASVFLPNASCLCADGNENPLNRFGAWGKRAAERFLSARFGEAIERWEMTRKIQKLSAQVPPNADGVEFSREVCRGFFSGHSRRVLAEFTARTMSQEIGNW